MSATRHFLKKVPTNAIWLSTGAKVPFVPLGEETAILATDDDLTIRELDECIAQKVMGVVALSKEKYDELLKKKPNLRQLSSLSPSTPASPEQPSPLSSHSQPQDPAADAAPAAVDVSTAEAEPKPEDGPTRGRRGRPRKDTEPAT